MATLTQDHPQIQFRKQHLGRYLETLVTKPYDGKMVNYLDFVGKMHTPKAGSSELNVPLVQMNALMGFVADALTATVLGLGLERDRETRHAAGVQQAAVDAERPHHPALSGGLRPAQCCGRFGVDRRAVSGDAEQARLRAPTRLSAG